MHLLTITTTALTTLPLALLTFLLLLTSTHALPVFHTNLPNTYPDRVEDLIPRSYQPPISRRQPRGDLSESRQAQMTAAALWARAQSNSDQDVLVKVGCCGFRGNEKREDGEGVGKELVQKPQMVWEDDARGVGEKRVRRDIRW